MITAGILSIIACAVTAYGWAAGRENTSEEITATEIVSERRIESAANAVNGKSLVVYFSVPETDGVDASSGASCVLSDGEVMGNTQYVAAIISEATGSDLFEIKTVHTYPGSHKALIDAAKVETDNKARPKLATHIENLQDYDVVFVDSLTGGMTCRCRSIRSSMSTTSAAKLLFRFARMAAAVSRMPSRPSGKWRKVLLSSMDMLLPAIVWQAPKTAY